MPLKSQVKGRYPDPFAGVDLSAPRIMGIVNVTPDSFSDGGETFAVSAAIARGREMIGAGAHILDIGGESTRPGASSVDGAEEIRRVLPVIQGLAGAGVPISIDTRRAAVMQAALDAGASIVNDVSALTHDASALEVVADGGAWVVLMHMKGWPETMNDDPRHDDVLGEVLAYLAQRVAACEEAGIARARIAVDPGIGFGKTMADNFRLLDGIGRFRELGCAVLVGVSRKIGRAAQPKDRLAESLSAAVDAAARGAHILRVHDVAETVAALGLGAKESVTNC